MILEITIRLKVPDSRTPCQARTGITLNAAPALVNLYHPANAEVLDMSIVKSGPGTLPPGPSLFDSTPQAGKGN